MGLMVMAAPIFILSLGLLFALSHNLIHEKVSESMNSMLNTTLHRVKYYMNTIETPARSNAWMLEENFTPDSLAAVSNRIVRLNRNVISSSVFVVPGICQECGHTFSVFSTYEADKVATYHETDYDYLERPCYTQAVNSGNACWVDPYIEYMEGKVDYRKAIATYSLPVKMEDGRIMGVVTADFSFSSMANILDKEEKPYPHAYYMLLGGDGRYLMHPDTTQLFKKTIFTDADPSKDKDLIALGHEMTSGNHGTMHVRTNGELYHVSYCPVPGTNWSLALVCPDGDAMKSYHYLGYVIIVLILLGLLAILLRCHYVVKRMIQPINRLIDITKKMADGHYDEKIPETDNKSVVGTLQNCFAIMQRSLNERMGKLRNEVYEIGRHNEELRQARWKVDETVQRRNQYLYHLTQQMRMPLNVITGFADVLGESSNGKNTISEEELSSITSMMKGNVNSMNRMVLMMLDATETDATEKLVLKRIDEVDCNEIARECVKYTQEHFRNSYIEMESDLQDGFCILTNRLYLACILRELLYNAVNYSDDKHITLHVDKTKTTVRFMIQDVGPELSTEAAEKVYKPFTKMDEMPTGTGIGLSLAKRHIIALDGKFIIDTDYHEGCRIIVEMPL
jgi:signal transduction histidine kinase